MGYSRRAAVGQLSGKRHIFEEEVVVGMEHIKAFDRGRFSALPKRRAQEDRALLCGDRRSSVASMKGELEGIGENGLCQAPSLIYNNSELDSWRWMPGALGTQATERKPSQ